MRILLDFGLHRGDVRNSLERETSAKNNTAQPVNKKPSHAGVACTCLSPYFRIFTPYTLSTVSIAKSASFSATKVIFPSFMTPNRTGWA
jgi:hypothetical protein